MYKKYRKIKTLKFISFLSYRNLTIALNSNFLIFKSLQPDDEDLWYIYFDQQDETQKVQFSQSLKYQRFTQSGLKDIGIKRIEFEASVQILILISYVGTLRFENQCLIPKSRDINQLHVDLHKIEINAWSRDSQHKRFDFSSFKI